MSKIQCLAMGRDGKQCSFKHESGYCHKHAFYRELNDTQKQQITRCSSCKAFTYLDHRCLVCHNESCYALMQNSQRCTFTVNHVNKHDAQTRSFYCKNHTYWNDFHVHPEEGFDREKLLQVLHHCSTCKNYFVMEEVDQLYATCGKCRQRRKLNPVINTERKCALDGCSYKASGEGGECYELFCGKHTTEA